jgi:hypothetical protein
MACRTCRGNMHLPRKPRLGVPNCEPAYAYLAHGAQYAEFAADHLPCKIAQGSPPADPIGIAPGRDAPADHSRQCTKALGTENRSIPRPGCTPTARSAHYRQRRPDRYLDPPMTPSLDPLVNGAVRHLFIFARFCVKHGMSAATFDTHRGARFPQLGRRATAGTRQSRGVRRVVVVTR